MYKKNIIALFKWRQRRKTSDKGQVESIRGKWSETLPLTMLRMLLCLYVNDVRRTLRRPDRKRTGERLLVDVRVAHVVLHSVVAGV